MTGTAAVFGSSICVASAYVWMKGYGSRIPPLAMTTIQSGAAVVPLLCLALVTDGIPAPSRWSPAAWGALAYLAVAASVVAFWLNYWLLARMDVSAMLMMGVAEVPIGCCWAQRSERAPARRHVRRRYLRPSGRRDSPGGRTSGKVKRFQAEPSSRRVFIA